MILIVQQALNKKSTKRLNAQYAQTVFISISQQTAFTSKLRKTDQITTQSLNIDRKRAQNLIDINKRRQALDDVHHKSTQNASNRWAATGKAHYRKTDMRLINFKLGD